MCFLPARLSICCLGMHEQQIRRTIPTLLVMDASGFRSDLLDLSGPNIPTSPRFKGR